MSDGKPGRPRLSPRTEEFVRQQLSKGDPTRKIAFEATQRGMPVSHETVRRIRTGKHRSPGESTSRLNPGETYHERPIRCSEGHLCHVLPCRTCAALRL